MEQILTASNILPIIFVAIMGFSILAYVILDGYDLGVGMLLLKASDEEKDLMVSSIGPFWDANETWLVLGVGILLIAFPEAHGIILSALYLPVSLMLLGLILRGVAFDFRIKAQSQYKKIWNNCFFVGSGITALTQGYMLGMYIVGFDQGWKEILFCIASAISLASGYCLIGSGWLIMKTSAELQLKSIYWSDLFLKLSASGLILISAVTPLVSSRIFDKWFSMPNFILLLPIPAFTAIIVIFLHIFNKKLMIAPDKLSWVPFAGTIAIFMLSFNGLCYSFYPYIIPDKLTIWQAASSNGALEFILVGVAIVLPCIIGYTIFSYKVFWGKV